MLINADVGECGLEIDSQIMPYVDMASIACGGHIGNQNSMKKTITLAKEYQVKIGAHLSYVDKKNFGRMSKKVNKNTLFLQLKTQLFQLSMIAQQQQIDIDYIKPHGALYHDMLTDLEKFNLILKLTKFISQAKLVVQFGLINKQRKQLAKKQQVQLLDEVFADRVYQKDGIALKPRTGTGAILNNVADIKAQFKYFSTHHQASTICFHSDNLASVKALQSL